MVGVGLWESWTRGVQIAGLEEGEQGGGGEGGGCLSVCVGGGVTEVEGSNFSDQEPPFTALEMVSSKQFR